MARSPNVRGERGMSGSGDQLAHEREPDLARPAEHDHPRETRTQPTDLQARLERLPVGHPSSPYRDDGSRKPSPSDLSELELPLPDELPSEPDQPDQDLPTEDKPHIAQDGSWHWKGLKLDAERSRAADQTVAKCHDAEKHLTPAMRSIESQIEQGHLVPETEKFALKEPDRFKEKFAKLTLDEPDSTPSELLSRINDGVRYTYLFEDEKYTAGVAELGTKLESAGFEPYERKNAWVDVAKAYQGINSTWMDHRSNQLFEVQIHTPASWKAKQESHRPYEVVESKNSTAKERAEAEKQQDIIFQNVPIPPRIEDITSYRKEGW
jgi:hypothetical protein